MAERVDLEAIRKSEAEVSAKLEAELEKPEGNRNADLVSLWRQRLTFLQQISASASVEGVFPLHARAC